MSNGGFLANPEQEPKEEPSFEAAPEAPTMPAVETEGLDEVAKAEQQALEQMAAEEQGEKGFLEQAAEQAAPDVAGTPAQNAEPAAAEQAKDEIQTEVEKILEEDLEPLVANMNPEDRAKFEKKGVEVSGQIANMVRSFKLKMEKVVTLIRGWLQTIPGVNKFFLEQEAKIKADKILDLEEEIKKDYQTRV